MKDLLLLYLVTINAAGFVLMLADKHKAKKKLWRIPEATLMTVAALGGSVGSLLGMYTVRHKTKHPKFTIGIPLILAAQLLIICVSFTQAAAFHNCEKAIDKQACTDYTISV